MIRVLIIEDEIPAREKLKRFLRDLALQVEIIGEIDTVAQGIAFLQQHNANTDLIFSDIELLDGNAFQIYSQVTVACPIIFATAYDQFWMNAFESNGIAYLLKPFSKEKFLKAWEKYQMFGKSSVEMSKLLNNLTELIDQNVRGNTFKKRFLVHHQQSMYFLLVEHICYFEANEGVVFAIDNQSKKHLLREATLKEIEDVVDPSIFFRINRGELINKLYIEKMERYTKNALAVKLKGIQQYLICSQSNTAPFRLWIEK